MNWFENSLLILLIEGDKVNENLTASVMIRYTLFPPWEIHPMVGIKNLEIPPRLRIPERVLAFFVFLFFPDPQL